MEGPEVFVEANAIRLIAEEDFGAGSAVAVSFMMIKGDMIIGAHVIQAVTDIGELRAAYAYGAGIADQGPPLNTIG